MLRGYDPVREEAHWTLICSGLTLGLATTAICFVAAQTPGDPEAMIRGFFSMPLYNVISLLFLILALVFWIISFSGHSRRIARTSHLRQKALTGTAPLCTPPSQEALPITLPYTIRMQIGPDFLKRCRSIAILWGISIISPFLIYRNLPLTENLYFTALRLILFLVTPAWLISSLVTSRYAAPRLTIDENTITAHYLGESVTMRWEGVRCFMLLDQNKPGSAWAFELSDGSNVIRWVDLSAKANNPYAPRMHPSQYSALMQTLPHWICTRTGLPLYNLRSQ